MEFTALCSGSAANCLYIRSGKTQILVDAGCSGRYLERSLASLQVDPAQLTAILITHEHTDHIKGAALVARRYNIPIYASELTWQSLPFYDDFMPWERHQYQYGSEIGNLGLDFFKLSHDAVQPVGLVFYEQNSQHKDYKLGVVTDSGCLTASMLRALEKVDALIIEANYSVEMLQHCRYPLFLKRRIASDHGHLSNYQAADLLAQVGGNLQAVLLAHLSQNSNTPQLALKEVNDRLGQLQVKLPCMLQIALRGEVSPLISLA